MQFEPLKKGYNTVHSSNVFMTFHDLGTEHLKTHYLKMRYLLSKKKVIPVKPCNYHLYTVFIFNDYCSAKKIGKFGRNQVQSHI